MRITDIKMILENEAPGTDANGLKLKVGDKVRGAGPNGPMNKKYGWKGMVSPDTTGVVTKVTEGMRISVKWDKGAENDHNSLEVEKI